MTNREEIRQRRSGRRPILRTEGPLRLGDTTCIDPLDGICEADSAAEVDEGGQIIDGIGRVRPGTKGGSLAVKQWVLRGGVASDPANWNKPGEVDANGRLMDASVQSWPG